MPRGDGTGPMGMGRMTGRGMGYCTGAATPGYANSVGFGGSFGCGRGFRRTFNVTGLPGWSRSGYTVNTGIYDPEISEKEILSNQVKFLEKQLQQAKKRISSLSEVDE